jgi:hypothetical protein
MSSFVLHLRSGRPFLTFPGRVNAAGARLTAGLAVAVAMLAALTGTRWLVAVLALDFAVRALLGPRQSPLGRLAAELTTRVSLPKTTTSGAPKQMAATAGAVMLGAAAVAFASGAATLGWSLTGALAVFAGLEAALGLCVVCRVYSLFVDCPDCVGER